MKQLSIDELIDRESHEIAKDILARRLAEHNLPLPKNGIDIHLDQLIAADPTIIALARKKVEARQDAYSEALRSIGISPNPIEVIDL